jgi:glutamate synthase (NADPH/NADH) large chain
VLDPDESFAGKCNMGMVELHQLTDSAEIKEIHTLISRHLQYTESEVARRILDDWDSAVTRFVKVMPTEYRRILEGQLDMKSDMAKLAAV